MNPAPFHIGFALPQRPLSSLDWVSSFQALEAATMVAGQLQGVMMPTTTESSSDKLSQFTSVSSSAHFLMYSFHIVGMY